MFFFSIVRAGDAIYVRVGDHDLTQKFGSPGAQTLRVATTYIHHNHNSQTLDNDIALLKLHGEAELKVICNTIMPTIRSMTDCFKVLNCVSKITNELGVRIKQEIYIVQ